MLYFSVHRYEHGHFWPNLRESDFDHVGGKAARGYNCNLPLNEEGNGNAEYLAVWLQLLLPIAYEVGCLKSFISFNELYFYFIFKCIIKYNN